MVNGTLAGRKYQMSIPTVMEKFRRGNTFGTNSITWSRPEEFKAKRHRLRAIQNPYSSDAIIIQREDFDSLEEEWTGTEERKGQMDRKEVVYQRDEGKCGGVRKFRPMGRSTPGPQSSPSPIQTSRERGYPGKSMDFT